MSHYAKLQSSIRNRKALVRALLKIGNPHGTCRYAYQGATYGKQLTPGMIEEHDQAQHLYGYENDQRAETANIIIRRKHVGGSSERCGLRP